MKSEFVADLESDRYHAHPAFSKSQLDKINKSPAHFQHSLKERFETKQMHFGSVMHTSILEPHTVNERYIIEPDGIDRRTKVGKEQWAEFQESAQGKDIISASEKKKADAIMVSVYSHPIAASILRASNRIIEGSFFWQDEDTGIPCRCRPDLYLPDARVLVDLKTSAGGKPGEFERHAWNFRYHVQSGFYSDGVEAVTKEPIDEFVFIVIETEAPFLVSVFYASPEFIDRGRFDYRRNLTTVAECKESGKWPGYGDEIFSLGLPAWVK